MKKTLIICLFFLPISLLAQNTFKQININKEHSYFEQDISTYTDGYSFNFTMDKSSSDLTHKFYWTGSYKNGKLNGKGTLTIYQIDYRSNDFNDYKIGEYYYKEVVEFDEGFKKGYSKIISRVHDTPPLEIYCNYINGRISGKVLKFITINNLEYQIQYNNDEKNADTRQIILEVKNNLLSNSNSKYIGSYNGNESTVNGKYYRNNLLSAEGVFELEHSTGFRANNLCDYFYEYYTFSHISGTKYFDNGVYLYSSEYSNGIPLNCATLYYPNGDRLKSCDFKFSTNSKNGKGVYYWADGSYYDGDFIDLKITKNGTFYDGKGNSKYGSFPTVRNSNDNDLFFGLAVIGLTAYGISELMSSSSNNSNQKKDNPITLPETKKASTNYVGSYSTYKNSSYERPKCGKCSGKGVCLECNGRGSKPCSKCDGIGTQRESKDPYSLTNFGMIDVTCTKCTGSGTLKCNECSGKGTCYKCEGKGTAY